MRKALMMAGLLVVFTANIVSAQAVDLNWNECESGTLDAADKTTACTSNTGLQNLIASFYPGPGVTNLEAITVVIDFQVAGGVLPCWWDLRDGATRVSALTVLGIDPLDPNTGEPLFKCPNNYFLDGAAGTAGGMVSTGVDRGRFSAAIALGAGQGSAPAQGEQYGCGFRISNALTTTCAGCTQPAVFVLNRITLSQPNQSPIELNSPQSANCGSWRSGTGVNCGAVPTRKSTWGSLKALYR